MLYNWFIWINKEATNALGAQYHIYSIFTLDFFWRLMPVFSSIQEPGSSIIHSKREYENKIIVL